MRILTNSPFESKGLISIYEASDNVPQLVVFCIPIDKEDAKRMTDIFDFQEYFYNGVSTKVKDGDSTKTIALQYEAPPKFDRELSNFPKFVANIQGHKIDFFLSSLNFNSKNNRVLAIEHFYSGNYLGDQLSNKRLVIVEPNWRQLDKLFLDEKIIFIDWK